MLSADVLSQYLISSYMGGAHGTSKPRGPKIVSAALFLLQYISNADGTILIVPYDVLLLDNRWEIQFYVHCALQVEC